MPELPEVEGFKTVVERHVVGRRIERARFLDTWMLKDSTPSAAARRMNNRTITTVDRRGKWLALFTDPIKGKIDAPVLTLHFGMTGHPLILPAGRRPHHWDRLVLELDSGEAFHYRNSRRLGFIRVVTRNEMADMAWKLGPDPLEAPVDYMLDSIPGRATPIKALLLDQSFLAGVGNIYADEALFAANIRPTRIAADLDDTEIRALHRHLQRILARAVKTKAAPGARAVFPLHAVRERASKQLGASGSPKVGCPKCGRPLRSQRIGGRTSFFCYSCQR